jgi:hypothetical protein
MGTGLDDLKSMQPAIDNVKESDIVTIRYPLKHFLHQCMLAEVRLEKYQGLLAPGGMDFTKVATIAPLSGACRELNSEFTMITFPNPQARLAYEKVMDEADALAYDLKAAMEFAFAALPELLAKIVEINQGASIADKINDFSDRYVLCRENIALFQAINYDVANIQRAGELSSELSRLHAQATLDKSSSEVGTTRNKALSLLKRTVDDLHRQAKFILRDNKKLAEEFRIEPPRRKPAAKTEPQPPTANA